MKKGYSTLEYAVFFLAAIIAFTGATVILRRAIAGRWRSATDQFGFEQQYEPYT